MAPKNLKNYEYDYALSSKSESASSICNTWKISIFIVGFFLCHFSLRHPDIFKYPESGLKNKFQFVLHSDEEKQDKDVCSIPKLSPGSPEVYELNLKQLPDTLLYQKPPPCIQFDPNDIRNFNLPQKGINQETMFAIDFDSNLVRLNPYSKMWNNISCYYKLFRMKLGKLLTNIFIQNETAINLTTRGTKLDPSAEYVHVTCRKNGSTELMYEDAFLNVPVKPDLEERLEKLPATQTPEIYPSVAIFGIDTTSQMNFQRYMPKVHKFLLDQMDAVEFHRFNSLGDKTRHNVYPLLTGIHAYDYFDMSKPELLHKLEKIRHLGQEFRDKGYRTSYGEDCALDPIFRHGEYSPLVRHPVDYDFRQLTSMLEIINVRRVSKKDYDACYGSRLTFQVVLDGLLKTASTFAKRNKPFWNFSWTSELTHDVNLYLKYAEPSLLNTLKKLDDERLLNNTILILMGDHGMRFGPLRQQTSQGFYEERLPLLYIVLPETFKRKYPMAVKNLRENSHKLVTAYDLHATLKSLLNPLSLDEMSRRTVDRKEKGVSLFQRISDQRTCNMTGIPSIYCACNRRTTITTDSPTIQNLTLAVVADINKRLRNHTSCYQIVLKKVTTAVLLDGIGSDANSSEYEIGFYTKPGKGAFYASVVFNSGNGITEIKNINRISDYHGDGNCVNVGELKQFCHCKNFNLHVALKGSEAVEYRRNQLLKTAGL